VEHTLLANADEYIIHLLDCKAHAWPNNSRGSNMDWDLFQMVLDQSNEEVMVRKPKYLFIQPKAET
jgi:hypothetical protein